MSKDGKRFKKVTPKLRSSTPLTLALPAERDYYFAVRAVRMDGSAGPYSKKLHVRREGAAAGEAAPTAKAAPAGLRGEPGESKARLHWRAPDYAVRGYHVYRVVKGQEKRLTKRPLGRTSLSLGGLRNGVEYSFFVTAVDEDGNESPPTKTVVVVPGN